MTATTVTESGYRTLPLINTTLAFFMNFQSKFHKKQHKQIQYKMDIVVIDKYNRLDTNLIE